MRQNSTERDVFGEHHFHGLELALLLLGRLVLNGCRNRAGLDQRHANTQLVRRLTKRMTERLNCCFGGDVNLGASFAQIGAHRSDVHNMPALIALLHSCDGLVRR